MKRGVLARLGDPIGEHWLGDFDTYPMPALSDGSIFTNLISLRAASVSELAGIVSRERLYFPWRFDSDWGMDTSYMQYAEGRIDVLTGTDARSYRASEPLRPRGLDLVNVDPSDAERAEPRIIVGGHPVGSCFGASFPMQCCSCAQPMHFLLQVQTGSQRLGFSVWDGETLYYGWCNKCAMLGVESHPE